ncbi:MAG TPA: ribulokinase [Spirochaetia bacterium]|nr:ribulokinase [Spirochaetia bacterium]
MSDEYVLGIDFGTDSIRTVVIDARTGAEAGVSVQYYPRWAKGAYCDPTENRFRQHPLDYIECLEGSIKEALAKAGTTVAKGIKGISVDTTGSTPVFVDRTARPLALLPEFAENPNAMFILWKDHTAVKEAERINELARSWGGIDYTKYEGGIYSSEWFWAKALHIVKEDPKVAEAAYSIVEHCDWIPALLTGVNDLDKIKRSRCAMGHKAMWHAEFEGGYPSVEFLKLLHPRLAEFRETLGTETYTTDQVFGRISPEWAKRLGIPESTVVGVGAFDAHIGAVGGDIKPYYLLKVMGTSTCDMLIAPKSDVKDLVVHGICGQVDGSIIAGYIGFEAGQSAFGDVYAWFKRILLWPLENLLEGTAGLGVSEAERIRDAVAERIIPELEKAARKVLPEESGVLALDWMNGRRTPDANQLLKGAIAGINLGTDAPRIYRALVEATAFGSRAIVERFRKEGVRIDGIIAIGGVARKSELVMQTVADVLNMKIEVSASDQSVALGAAMFAATVAGLYPNIEAAQKALSAGFERTYWPDSKKAAIYDRLYEKYLRFGSFVEKELT